ncbi:hypothetical protein ETB97_004387 [Aspergillus alliaceus]|uniref:Uncharacterized protein n=1 Tax=Petromyces alliaceus TaxID=209559 RepID=A0A8H6A305_PETAA|nr:hypothetical protein ETB97_004387 [Aspergillus burnettii]
MSQWVALVVGSKMVELSRKSKVPKVYKLMKPARSKLTQDDRLDVKFHLQQLYQGFPAQRVWLYLKVMQNLPNFDERDFKKQVHELEIHGQEDDVAKCEHTPTLKIVSLFNLIHSHCLVSFLYGSAYRADAL